MATRNDWLSQEASLDWMKEHGYVEPYKDHFPSRGELYFSGDSGRSCSLVRSILNWLPSDGHALLHVTLWDVWPSAENEELFLRLREWPNRERRSLSEAPGHVLDLADRATLECLLDVCLYNFWDATLADGMQRFLITTSHDQFIEIATLQEYCEAAAGTIEVYDERRKGA